MSRGVKDLRELICVSRLTFRDSDEELTFSDQEGRLSRAFEDISFGIDSIQATKNDSDLVTGSSSDNHSRQGSAHSTGGRQSHKSVDSGFGTNGRSPENNAHLPRPPDVDKTATARKKKRKRKKASISNILPIGQYELPKPAPLPPVRSDNIDTTYPSSSDSSDGRSVSFTKMSPKSKGTAKTMAIESNVQRNMKLSKGPLIGDLDTSDRNGNFDDILGYFDSVMISEWLAKANQDVTDITTWCHKGENFVHFAHFWLSDFPETQRMEICRLEYSILIDHFMMAFSVGRREGAVRQRDISEFLSAIFREYPHKLMSTKNSFMFLDYLDLLTSERHNSYKKLLADVRCSTKVKQFAQWTLAARAFCLVSIWTAVLNFYRKLAVREDDGQCLPLSAVAKTSPHTQRMFHSIRNGFVDVVHYLLKTGKVKANYQDNHQRSLVFTAVAHNQPAVLRYFIHKIKPPPDLNAPADNGNTPLHAAANNGNVILVTALLESEMVDINAQNPQCDNATPLHLAVMHGHRHVVEVLLVTKADKTLKMGELTVEEIAKEFGHDDILEILQRSSQE